MIPLSRLLSRWSGAALLVAGVGAFALTTGQAAPARAQASAFSLSPEEAAIGLLPYQLDAASVPSGYTLGQSVISTNVTNAVSAPDPKVDFAAAAGKGYVLNVSQTLNPVNPNTQPTADFAVVLLADSAATHAYATGQALPPTAADSTEQIQTVSLDTPYGDASVAWRDSSFAVPGQTNRESGYTIRWQRGWLAFRVDTYAVVGGEKLADAQILAAAIDQRLATLPQPMFGAPTVMPPATEAQRLDATLALRKSLIAPAAALAGYTAQSPNPFQAADVVAGTVGAGATPSDQLQRVDQQWKLVAGLDEQFTNAQDPSKTLDAQVEVCADVAGATADVNDPNPSPNQTVTTLPAPVQLGDTTTAYLRETTNPDGSQTESAELNWTHGNVLLFVGMYAKPGQTSLDTLSALAQQAEAAYQAHPYTPAQ